MRLLVTGFMLFLCASSFAAVDTQPAPTEIDQLRSENVTLRAQLVDLQRQLAAARGTTTKPATTRPKAMSEIDRAILDHRLVNGMTLKQAVQAMGGDGSEVSKPDTSPAMWHATPGDFYRQWGVPVDAQREQQHLYRAHFSNGTIAQFEKQ